MDLFAWLANEKFEAYLAKLPELIAQSHDIAEKIAQIARDTAPVDSGDYVAGIIVEDNKAGARVYASAPDSAFVEFGVPSTGQPAQFVLRRAVEAAGFSFKKRGA